MLMFVMECLYGMRASPKDSFLPQSPAQEERKSTYFSRLCSEIQVQNTVPAFDKIELRS